MQGLLLSLGYFITLSWITTKQPEVDFYSYRPEQVHISFGENVSAIVVMWSTKEFTESVCHYGIGFKNLTLTAKGSSTKFVDGGKKQQSQYFHQVTLSNLEPKSQYFYHCGSDLGWSNIFSFNTVPADTEWSPRLAVYGDLGVFNAQSIPRLQQDVASGIYDAILHIGDFAYDFSDDDGERGDQFMRLIEPIAAYMPYMVTVGNHENHYNFSHYKARFSMPETEENMFYTFDLGPAHFIAFSSEVYYLVDNQTLTPCVYQYHWLEEKLKEATKPENRAKHPWIITLAHQPMYCANIDTTDCTYEKAKIRTGYTDNEIYCDGLEKMFYDYGVDLEIWAHEHSYERLWPVFNQTVYNGSLEEPYTDPQAPVHIVTGSAGCSEFVDYFVPNPPAWSAFRSSDYGYSRMQIFNNTHLHLEQVSDDKDGEIIDHLWLIKNKHGSYKQNIEL